MKVVLRQTLSSLYISVSKLNVVLQMQIQNCWVEGSNHFPGLTGVGIVAGMARVLKGSLVDVQKAMKKDLILRQSSKEMSLYRILL